MLTTSAKVPANTENDCSAYREGISTASTAAGILLQKTSGNPLQQAAGFP